jgi:hypothetical protein
MERKRFLNRPLQAKKHRHRIPRSAAQSTLHWQSLIDAYDHPPAAAQGRNSKFCSPPASIPLIPRNPRILTPNLDPGPAYHLNPN